MKKKPGQLPCAVPGRRLWEWKGSGAAQSSGSQMVFFGGPLGFFKKGFMEVSSLTSAAVNITSTSVSFRYWSSTKKRDVGKKGFTVKNIIETISPDLVHRKETLKKCQELAMAFPGKEA